MQKNKATGFERGDAPPGKTNFAELITPEPYRLLLRNHQRTRGEQVDTRKWPIIRAKWPKRGPQTNRQPLETLKSARFYRRKRGQNGDNEGHGRA